MGKIFHHACTKIDREGNLTAGEGALGSAADGKMDDVIFLNFSRLITKDEIKKGSFQVAFNTGSHPTGSMWDDNRTITIASTRRTYWLNCNLSLRRKCKSNFKLYPISSVTEDKK